jgi:hypothetical protein
VKLTWKQNNKKGKTVKFDRDPSNDYQDGYNAGRRMAHDKDDIDSTFKYVLAALAGALIVFIAYVSSGIL